MTIGEPVVILGLAFAVLGLLIYAVWLFVNSIAVFIRVRRSIGAIRLVGTVLGTLFLLGLSGLGGYLFFRLLVGLGLSTDEGLFFGFPVSAAIAAIAMSKWETWVTRRLTGKSEG
jgi:hypothetical protein